MKDTRLQLISAENHRDRGRPLWGVTVEEGPGPLLLPHPGDARFSRQGVPRLATIRPPLSLQTCSPVGPGVDGPAVVRSPRTCWEVWGGGGGNSSRDSSAPLGGAEGWGEPLLGEGRGLSGQGPGRGGPWTVQVEEVPGAVATASGAGTALQLQGTDCLWPLSARGGWAGALMGH